jgi:squalene-associated FAD-dependent desaturase
VEIKRNEHATEERVVIIGGGLAGCSAALALARIGVPVTLVETKSRLGGRAGSYTDQASGISIDYCQHVGMACCTNLRQLIQWLGQEDQWRTEKELYFFGPGPQRQTLRALPFVPAPAHLAAWLWRWPGLSWSERLSVGRGILALNHIALSDVNSEQCSALEWLQAHGQSAGALERFWGTIVVSALGEELQCVGLLPMAKVFQDGFLRHPRAFHLLIPQRPLDDLFGRQLYNNLLEHGVEVLLGTKSEEMTWEGGRCRALRLTNGRRLSVGALIVAVPWHAVEGVVGNCPEQTVRQLAADARQLKTSPISGVHTWWNRAWLPTPHAVLVGQLCQWVFSQGMAVAATETSPVVDPAANSAEHYYQVVISASRSLPRGESESIKRLIEADLKSVFPEARSAELVRLKVVTDPQAVFSVGPGSSRLRPEAGSYLGNVYWAGDWVKTGWPATMEGAVISGFKAAERIAEHKGLTARFLAPPL